MINDVLPVKTEYLSSRQIRIEMTDNNDRALAYIFEYSTVNTTPDDWVFAVRFSNFSNTMTSNLVAN